jgi:hypothetical protein
LQDRRCLGLFDDRIAVWMDDFPAPLFQALDVRHPDYAWAEFLLPDHAHLLLF